VRPVAGVSIRLLWGGGRITSSAGLQCARGPGSGVYVNVKFVAYITPS